MWRWLQKMMASMKPEDIAAMQRQAGQMGMGGGAPGGMDQQEQMAKMMQDPDTMKAVQVSAYPPPPPPAFCQCGLSMCRSHRAVFGSSLP